MNSLSAFKGVTTALITPFKSGIVDYLSLKNILSFQWNAGVRSFVVNGTTAESPTLEIEESVQLLKFIKSEFPQAHLMFGAGSNSTKHAIELSELGQKHGADALLSVVPYYNKPTQEGLYQHFKAVAESTNLPVFLYNVPGRTITTLNLETVARLAELNNIIGLKEASGQIDFAQQLRAKLPQDFILLSGDDSTFNRFMDVGGDGIISVCSHIIPQIMLGVYKRDQKAIERFNQLIGNIDQLYIEPNPVPTKFALHQMGQIQSFETRLPLVPLSEKNQSLIQATLGVLHD